MRIRIFPFTLMRVRIRILPFNLMRIRTGSCCSLFPRLRPTKAPKWPSKASTFSLWCGSVSKSCFPLWFWTGSRCSFHFDADPDLQHCLLTVCHESALISNSNRKFEKYCTFKKVKKIQVHKKCKMITVLVLLSYTWLSLVYRYGTVTCNWSCEGRLAGGDLLLHEHGAAVAGHQQRQLEGRRAHSQEAGWQNRPGSRGSNLLAWFL